jgi:hypothetical protein
MLWILSNCHHHDLNDDVAMSLRVSCGCSHPEPWLLDFHSAGMYAVSSMTLPKPGPKYVPTHGERVVMNCTTRTMCSTIDFIENETNWVNIIKWCVYWYRFANNACSSWQIDLLVVPYQIGLMEPDEPWRLSIPLRFKQTLIPSIFGYIKVPR